MEMKILGNGLVCWLIKDQYWLMRLIVIIVVIVWNCIHQKKKTVNN